MKQLRTRLKLFGISLLVLIVVFLGFNHFNPRPLLSLMGHYYGMEFSYREKVKESQEIDQDGNLIIKNISYPSSFPNNYLDIYVSNGDKTTPKPTLILFHGGGWALGDKTSLTNGYLEAFIKEGYNIVNVNYALSPDYTYPSATLQGLQALNYVASHAQNYGIDKNYIILSGNSAGGQISGQLTLIQSNPQYAREMGVTPADLQVQAFVSNSGAIKLDVVTQTGSLLADWIFGSMGKAYLLGKQWQSFEEIDQADVYKNLSESFPPSYITDGTEATFPQGAEAFAKRLTQLGVENQLYIPPKESKQRHDYQFNLKGSTQAQYNLKKTLEFLDKVKCKLSKSKKSNTIKEFYH